MKSINTKKIVAFLLIAIIIISISSVVFGSMSIDQVRPKTGDATNRVFNIAGVVLGIAQAIGISVAVVMLIVIAIKYITASADGKADIKKSAMQYVVGAILLFGGVAILELIQRLAITM